jgi:hypothetical protein
MDSERRTEDMILVFYSSAVKLVRKDKSINDNSWKIVLYVRLMNATLKDRSFDNDIPTPLIALLNGLDFDLDAMVYREIMERSMADSILGSKAIIAHAPAKS